MLGGCNMGTSGSKGNIFGDYKKMESDERDTEREEILEKKRNNKFRFQYNVNVNDDLKEFKWPINIKEENIIGNVERVRSMMIELFLNQSLEAGSNKTDELTTKLQKVTLGEGSEADKVYKINYEVMVAHQKKRDEERREKNKGTTVLGWFK